MIAFVNGVVRIIRSDRVVLDVHGVGYEVYLANALSQKMGDELFLYTYQHVREDAILLFGFLKEEDYEVFALVAFLCILLEILLRNSVLKKIP